MDMRWRIFETPAHIFKTSARFLESLLNFFRLLAKHLKGLTDNFLFFSIKNPILDVTFPKISCHTSEDGKNNV